MRLEATGEDGHWWRWRDVLRKTVPHKRTGDRKSSVADRGELAALVMASNAGMMRRWQTDKSSGHVLEWFTISRPSVGELSRRQVRVWLSACACGVCRVFNLISTRRWRCGSSSHVVIRRRRLRSRSSSSSSQRHRQRQLPHVFIKLPAQCLLPHSLAVSSLVLLIL